MNYQLFYGLAFNPFEKTIEVKHIFESQDYKQFASRMEYFKSSKRFACVFGEPDSGKTTSLRVFTSKAKS
jgi:type II secretory pathway predicted ATPase ExeA